jgi:hypothetical protein
MSRVVDTLGQVTRGQMWITLRADLPGGVSLGSDASIEPGETKQVPVHIAMSLIHTQRAVPAQAPAAVVDTPAVEAPSPEPVPTADVAPPRQRKK